MLDSKVLYVSARLPRTRLALRSVLEKNHLSTAEPYRGVLAVHFNPGKFLEQFGPVAEALSREELLETKCRVAESGAELGHSEFMHSQSLASFLASARGQWLTAMIGERRLTTFFQPIVECREPGKVFAYECLLRGQSAEGQLVSPDRLYTTARDAGLLDLLDNTAKLTHIGSSARFSLDTNIFINFNPAATRDLDASLRKTLDAIRASGIPSERFVFEVIESDKIENADSLEKVLARYRATGFKVALDDMGSGYNSLNCLTQIKPDYMKLDMQLIRGVHRDPYKSCVAAKLLEMAHDLGVATVVEGVEEEGEWEWSVEHGGDFAAGYLFARPAAQPPQPQFAPSRLKESLA